MRAPDVVPRPSGGVVHAMAVSVASGCRKQHVRRREASRVWLPRTRSDRRPGSSGRSGPVRPENVAPRTGRVRACVPARCCPGNGGARVTFDVDLRPWSRDDIGRHGKGVGHHDGDAGSVLGTVQGSSLRSARTSARPAGLDGACAQITSWPLRDGRRVNAATGGAGAAIWDLIPAVRITRAITASEATYPPSAVPTTLFADRRGSRLGHHLVEQTLEFGAR